MTTPKMLWSPEAIDRMRQLREIFADRLAALALDRARISGRELITPEDVDAVLVEAANTVAAEADDQP